MTKLEDIEMSGKRTSDTKSSLDGRDIDEDFELDDLEALITEMELETEGRDSRTAKDISDRLYAVCMALIDEHSEPSAKNLKHEPPSDIEGGVSPTVTRTACIDAAARGSDPTDRVVSLPLGKSVSRSWMSPSAVLPQDQRLAAFSRAGYRGWLSVVVKIDDNTVARLRALFRKDGRVRIVRVDSGDSIIGVFDDDDQNVGELKKANDEALVFLGKDQPTESDLVDHLKIKLSDR